MVLDQNRVRQSGGCWPSSSGIRLRPSPASVVPPISLKVSARSTFSVIASVELPAGTPGPATTSGTWMSVSKAVSLPGMRRYSPVCSPLSELNTM